MTGMGWKIRLAAVFQPIPGLVCSNQYLKDVKIWLWALSFRVRQAVCDFIDKVGICDQRCHKSACAAVLC